MTAGAQSAWRAGVIRAPDGAAGTPASAGVALAAKVRAYDPKADIGLIEGEIDDPALAMTQIAEDEMVLVVGRAHPWAGRAAVGTEPARLVGQ